MNSHEAAAPVEEKFLTPGVMVMVALMMVRLGSFQWAKSCIQPS